MSSKLSFARVSVGATAALFALALRGSLGCGTQPCFRHSDCASSDVCSAGECVPAPVDVPGLPDASGIDVVVSDGLTPVVDTSTPLPEASREADADAAATNADADAATSVDADAATSDVADAATDAADSAPE